MAAIGTTGTAGLSGSELASTVNSVLNFQGLSAADDADALAAGYDAQGAAATAQGYRTAAEIAADNQQLALISGQLENTMEERNVLKTLGAQKAEVAGAGFGNAGSALFLAADSRRQGYLQEQLTTEQASLDAGGYAAQGAAAQTEAAAADIATSAQTALAAKDASNSALMKSYAAAESGALATLTGGSTESRTISAPVWNGTSWVYPTPQQQQQTAAAGIANQIAGTTASGNPLTPDQLQSAAVAAAGGGTAANTGFIGSTSAEAPHITVKLPGPSGV